jgi:hypothetical protein
MKNCIGILMLIVLLYSCKKEGSLGVKSGDEVVVMVYATPPSDTIKVAATDTVRITIK